MLVFFLCYYFALSNNNVRLIKQKQNKMKIEWGTIVAILIALVAFKLIDTFVLDKAVNKLEEVIN